MSSPNNSAAIKEKDAIQSSSELTSVMGLSDTLTFVLSLTQKLLNVAHGAIYLTDSSLRIIKIEAGFGLFQTEIGQFCHREEGIPGQIWVTAKPVILSDTSFWLGQGQHKKTYHFQALLGIPLSLKQEIIGVMIIANSRSNSLFTVDNLTTLTQLTHPIMLAVENKQLQQTKQQQIKERERAESIQNAVYRIAQAADKSQDLAELFQAVHKIIGNVMPANNFYIALYNQKDNLISFPYFVDEFDKPPPPRASRHGITEYVLRTGVPLRCTAEMYQSLIELGEVEYFGPPSSIWLGVPLIANDKTIGLMVVQHYSNPQAYDDLAFHVLKFISAQIARAIARKRNEEERERLLQAEREQRLLAQTLNEVTLAIAAQTSHTTMLDEILYQAERLVPYRSAHIALLKENTLHIAHWRGYENEKVQTNIADLAQAVSNFPLDAKAIKTQVAQIISDTHENSEWVVTDGADWVRSCLIAPISLNQQVLGLLRLDSNKTNQFSNADAERLQPLTNAAAIALQNSALYQQIQQHTTELEARVAERTFELQTLYKLTRALGDAVQFSDIIRLILLHLYQAIPYDVAASLLINSSNTLVIQSRHKLSNEIQYQIKNSLLTNLQQEYNYTLNPDTLEVRLLNPEDATLTPLKQLNDIKIAPIFTHYSLLHTKNSNSNNPNTNKATYPTGLLLIATEQLEQFDEEHHRILHTIADQAAESIHRLQSLLAAEHQRLNNVISYLPNGVILLNAEHCIVLANQVAEKLLPYLTQVVKGEKLTELGNVALKQILTTGSSPQPLEINAISSSKKIFEVKAETVTVGTEAGGWVIVIQDVTEERASRERMQLQDRLAAVGQLAAGITHDFNNILTSIIGVAEIAQSTPNISETLSQGLADIILQGERAAHLIRQILDFSRQSVSAKQPISLIPFIQEIIKLLERTIPENIRITFKVDSTSYTINADQAQLQQALTNLAINARDAMPDGGLLKFKVSKLIINKKSPPPRPNMKPGKWVMLSITDTGTGIDPEHQAHIFEPFFTTKDIGQGTGLGLSQVYGIIKQHHGEIDMESEIGVGTTFTMYFPTIAPIKKLATKKQKPNLTHGKGELILVVEDDFDVLRVIEIVLKRLNYKVLTASNGKEALQIHEDHYKNINLVLTDITMPDMSGFELAQALVKKQPTIKIVAITGYPLYAESNELLALGIIDWVQKPMNVEKLAQTVDKALRWSAPNKK